MTEFHDDHDDEMPLIAYSNAELGAIAHLYRGEVYRSTIWRTRLDATTNWSVVTLGVAMSISYASPTASPVPLMLAGVFITLFLYLEGRRYRYFNVWRARARWLETHFYAPMLRQGESSNSNRWQTALANDYLHPTHHISMLRAVGRRLRRNYLWIFIVQALAYLGKVVIHPTPAASFDIVLERMALGPIPGALLFMTGGFFLAMWISVSLYTRHLDQKKHGDRMSAGTMG